MNYFNVNKQKRAKTQIQDCFYYNTRKFLKLLEDRRIEVNRRIMRANDANKSFSL